MHNGNIQPSISLLTNFGSVKYLRFQTSIDLVEGAHCALKGALRWDSDFHSAAACDRISSGGHTQHDLHFHLFHTSYAGLLYNVF